MRSRLLYLPAAAALSLALLTGCNTEANTSTAAPSTTNRETMLPSGPASPSQTVLANANTATVAEITAAFSSAGVPDAEKWAAQVVEHRPYSGTDGWSALRQDLDQDTIDDATFSKITSVLQAT